MPNTSYYPVGPQISWEEFDNEYVVLDLGSGRYFSLAGGAADLWRVILARHAPLADLASDHPAKGAISHCLEALVEAKVIAKAGPGQGAGDWAAAYGAFDFSFDAFEDLAALLVADPIHDVTTDAGWPRRENA